MMASAVARPPTLMQVGAPVPALQVGGPPAPLRMIAPPMMVGGKQLAILCNSLPFLATHNCTYMWKFNIVLVFQHLRRKLY